LIYLVERLRGIFQYLHPKNAHGKHNEETTNEVEVKT
jgi:hypothetical protein